MFQSVEAEMPDGERIMSKVSILEIEIHSQVRSGAIPLNANKIVDTMNTDTIEDYVDDRGRKCAECRELHTTSIEVDD